MPPIWKQNNIKKQQQQQKISSCFFTLSRNLKKKLISLKTLEKINGSCQYQLTVTQASQG